MKLATKSIVLAVAILSLLPVAGAVVQTATQDDFRTLVTLTCHGKGTSATARILITHDGRPLREVTLECSREHKRADHLFTTELKPDDWHIVIRVMNEAHHNDCSKSGSHFPAYLACRVDDGRATVKIARP